MKRFLEGQYPGQWTLAWRQVHDSASIIKSLVWWSLNTTQKMLGANDRILLADSIASWTLTELLKLLVIAAFWPSLGFLPAGNIGVTVGFYLSILTMWLIYLISWPISVVNFNIRILRKRESRPCFRPTWGRWHQTEDRKSSSRLTMFNLPMKKASQNSERYCLSQASPGQTIALGSYWIASSGTEPASIVLWSSRSERFWSMVKIFAKFPRESYAAIWIVLWSLSIYRNHSWGNVAMSQETHWPGGGPRRSWKSRGLAL